MGGSRGNIARFSLIGMQCQAVLVSLAREMRGSSDAAMMGLLIRSFFLLSLDSFSHGMQNLFLNDGSNPLGIS